MAKSKITYEWEEDYRGRSVLVVRRKKGKLTWSEVLEELTDSGEYYGRRLLLELNVTGELPMDLYDEGDVWMLYQPDDYLGKEGAERLRPKKAIEHYKEPDKFMCPTCSAEVEYEDKKYTYCRECGQEVYWDN